MPTTNQNRAERARVALRAYVEAKGEVFEGGSHEIAELMTDLMHLTVEIDQGDDPVASTIQLAYMRFETQLTTPEGSDAQSEVRDSACERAGGLPEGAADHG